MKKVAHVGDTRGVRFAYDEPWQKVLGSISEEWLQNGLLVAFDIDFQNINVADPLFLKQIEKSCLLYLDNLTAAKITFWKDMICTTLFDIYSEASFAFFVAEGNGKDFCD